MSKLARLLALLVITLAPALYGQTFPGSGGGSVVTGASTPGSCVAPSLFYNTVGTSYYGCTGTTYSIFQSSSSGVSAVAGTSRQVTVTTSSGTATVSLPVNILFPGNWTAAAGTTSNPSFNVPSGVAPTSPTSGDFWNLSGVLQFYDGATSQSLMFKSTVLASAQMPTFTGDVTNSGLAMTVARIAGTTVSGTTGTTNAVFSNSPTLVTPALGTPSALVLTSATGLPLTTGVTGALPRANGGLNSSSAGTGILRDGTTPAASELSGDATTSGSNAVTVVKINGTSLAGLATGIVKNTTTTGVPSIAVAADFPTLNQNTSGTAATITGALALANTPLTTSQDILYDNAGSLSRLALVTSGTCLGNTGGAWASLTCSGGSGGSVFTGSTATAPAFSATPTFSLADVSVKSPLRVEPGALTANVTSVTFSNKSAGAKFSIAWTQDATGGRTVSYGASATNTCAIDAGAAASSVTTQFFEVGSDGTTVNGTGCIGSTSDIARGPEEAAPGTPAASTGVCWFDSTNHVYSCKENNSSTVSSAVVPLTCSSKAVTAVSAGGVLTCATLTSAYVDTSIAQTGVDINTSFQVTATHLGSALPVNQGGTGTTSTLTGLVRGNSSAMTAAELSGDVATSGSNAATVARVNGITYSATAAAHTVEVITTANTTATAKVLPDCTDSGGNHINFTQSTNAFSCGTSSSGSGGTGTSITSVTPVTATANSTSDQQLMELSMAAGYFNSATQPFLFNGAGVYSTPVAQTPTLTFKVKLCTVSGCGSGTAVTLVSIVSTATLASVTNNNWDLSFMGYTATTGATGNLEIHGPVSVDLGALTTTADSIFVDTNTAVSSNIDLTAALFVDFTVTTSTGSASNAITQRAGGVMPFAATAAPVTSVNTLTGAVALFATNAQTATYQALAADFTGCKTIPVASGTFTITLVASGSQPASGQCLDVVNYGSGVVTIARSGQNINGGTASVVIESASATLPSWAHVVSDGTNYFVGTGFGNAMTTAGDTIYAGTTGLPTRLAGAAGLYRSSGTVPSYAELSGDVTTSGSNAATVVQVEGGAIPASAPFISTNSSKQLVLASPFATNPTTIAYQVLAADFSNYKTINVASGSFTITLVASGSQPATGQTIDIINYGSGVVTIARSGQNINGGTASFVLESASALVPSRAHVVSDATNYFISGDFANPMTTAGDTIYAGTTGLPTRLAGAAGLARSSGTTPSYAELSGDVTTSGSNAATVVQVEGAAIPASAPFISTNSSKQLVLASPFATNPTTIAYQVLAADFSNYKTINVASGSFTITLVASGSQPPTGQTIDIINYGSGVVTIARSSQNINGGTASFVLESASALTPSRAHVVSDGTNYFISGDFANPMTTAGDIIYAGTTGLPTRLATGTAKQLLTAGTTPAYIDFPDMKTYPSANCVNTTAGSGWSLGASGVVTCRAGTNNLGGYVTITDTASSFAQFMVPIPVDWDTGTLPYLLFGLSSTDTTNAHTIIPQIKVSCPTATNGTVSDDHAFAAAHSATTITIGASAVSNGFYTTSIQTNSTDMTGCVAGAFMIVQVGRATDTATSANFYYSNVTFPRLLTVQAN